MPPSDNSSEITRAGLLPSLLKIMKASTAGIIQMEAPTAKFILERNKSENESDESVRYTYREALPRFRENAIIEQNENAKKNAIAERTAI